MSFSFFKKGFGVILLLVNVEKVIDELGYSRNCTFVRLVNDVCFKEMIEKGLVLFVVRWTIEISMKMVFFTNTLSCR